MRQEEVLNRISALVEEEHTLRRRVQAGELSTGQEQRRLADLELALDQCWDLLRRRRARRDTGQDPDSAVPRPPDEVERYQQ